MPSHFKRTLIVSFFTALCLCCFEVPGRCEAEWSVLFSGLPTKITPEAAGENVIYYILKQTHEPLFRKDDGQNFQSRVLRRWARDISFSSYTFCLDTSLEFDSYHPFTPSVFADHLRKVTFDFDPSADIALKDGCVNVHFKKPAKMYLNFLSLYENAPTFKQSDNVHIGLGEFYVSDILKDKVILLRKQKVGNGYNKIVIYEYGGGGVKFPPGSISDFNRVPVGDVPTWVCEKYVGFNNALLKSIVLVINHPDKDVRETVYNCMDVDELRKAFLPANPDFYDIENILPVGIPGGVSGRPSQSCFGKARLSGKELIFANWRIGNETGLQEFMANFNKRTGMRVVVNNYTTDALVAQLFIRPHKYHLVIVTMDAVRPEHSAFFDYILRKDGYLDFNLPKINSKYHKMLYEGDPVKKYFLGMEIAQEIKKEAVVLPLYQEVRVFYYPPEIKNFMVGRGFLEYPEVGDFRW